MRIWLLVLLFFSAAGVTFGQTPIPQNPAQQQNNQPIKLISSVYTKILNQNTFSSLSPLYEHNGNTLKADSGVLYEDDIKRQFFEAFGNVVITQPSGTVIYAERLHYDVTTQHAILTRNVRMVDGPSVLTTNYLTYNMRSKTGTYTGGGRIISKGDTITSKNAYYFELTKDAYFRNQVVVRTPDVKIFTDTMRYNSLERVTYFFGPTNIKGNNGENLYTELGNYNTGTDVAKFSKNNLYTEGSKFLKGDSLYYERNGGFGEAFRNVVFIDTLDKFYANGGYGLYKQGEESILMTDKPLITYVIVQDDTTQNNVAQDSVALDEEKTLSRREKRRLEKEAEVENQADLSDSTATEIKAIGIAPQPEPKIDSVYMTADTLFSKVILVKDYKPLDLKLNRDGGEILDETDIDYGDDEDEFGVDSLGRGSLELDSLGLGDIQRGTDSLETKVGQELVKKAEEKIDSTKIKTAKPIVAAAKKELTVEQTVKADSLLRNNAEFPSGLEADSLLSKAITSVQLPDTTIKDSTIAYSDTARTRIVNAYYNVRLFKSDLQAVADSVYYGMVDSMFRFMGKPMIWAEGSQISADTLFLQIKNQKLDNALLKDNAFMVNVVLDTVKFNQLKGRKITAFFTNNNVDRIYVDGNAENLIFTSNDSLNIINEMFHDRSSRIKIKMENKEIIDYVSAKKVDQKVYPFKLVSAENEILPGFIWRPQDRPKSKEDLLNRKREVSTPVDPNEKPENPGKRTVQDEVIDKILENKDKILAPPLKKAE
ncbi:OstA-like protein [Sphingobacterium hungaricum]|uniref:OstA-like protein n=1 Tax=Sphingobacterium hungaricum TaxID=2082723 RepID=UPI001E3150B6|nr:OstA-like protein [Sphingobacterium hungaricum]